MGDRSPKDKEKKKKQHQQEQQQRQQAKVVQINDMRMKHQQAATPTDNKDGGFKKAG